MIVKIIAKLVLIILALFLVAYYIPGISVDSFYTAFIAALLLGLANLIIKPILLILTLPITVLTLGLFTFVINGALFWFIASFVEGFEVSGFLVAIIGAFIVSIVSWIGNKILI
jgi:putative membrane protein